MSTNHTPSQLADLLVALYQRDAMDADITWQANHEDVSHVFVSPADESTPGYLAIENTREEELRLIPRTVEVLNMSGVIYIRAVTPEGDDQRVTIVRMRRLPFTPEDLGPYHVAG